ncbi:hypothetical protein Tco_0454019 [Tanacetum coccineum]
MYVLSLHKIHAVSFLEDDLEEKMNRLVQKEFKTFNEEARLSIQHWKDLWHKRMYKLNQRKLIDNPEEYFSKYKIVEVVRITTEQQHRLDYMEQLIMMRENDKSDSFSEADFKYLNKNDIEDIVLKEVKIKIFETEFWKKAPLLGELDLDIMKEFEREITKRLRHREQMRR